MTKEPGILKGCPVELACMFCMWINLDIRNIFFRSSVLQVLISTFYCIHVLRYVHVQCKYRSKIPFDARTEWPSETIHVLVSNAIELINWRFECRFYTNIIIHVHVYLFPEPIFFYQAKYDIEQDTKHEPRKFKLHAKKNAKEQFNVQLPMRRQTLGAVQTKRNLKCMQSKV